MSEAAIVQIVVGVVVGTIGGTATAVFGIAKWVISRIDGRIELYDRKIEAYNDRIIKLERESAKQDFVENLVARLELRIDGWRREMTDRLDRIIDGRK